MGMRSKGLSIIAAIAVLLVGCSSGSSRSEPVAKPPVSIGKSVVSPTRNETVEAYAERVLTQSLNSPLVGAAQAGDLSVGQLKVCIPAQAKAQVVRASDYVLVLANGKRIIATTGAVSPTVSGGRVSPGACVRGTLNWIVAPDNHPTIVDERTGAQWKPKCPQETSSTGPCEDLGIAPRA